jgi:hypothetical protein
VDEEILDWSRRLSTDSEFNILQNVMANSIGINIWNFPAEEDEDDAIPE